MIGIWAYYLLSPFNLLFLLVQKTNISNMFISVVALKFLASAITMQIFLKNKCDNNLGTIFGSLCYAFCGYSISYQMNIMWIDGVVLLPLIAFGIEKIVKEDKPLLYVISVAISLISNFYIGFSTTLFGGFYFLYTLFKEKMSKKSFIIILKYAFYSIIAIGISAIILIPTVYVIFSGRDTETLLNLSNIWKSNFSLIDFLSKLLPGTTDDIQLYNDTQALPNIYSGLIMIILTIFYFANSEIKIKDKILSFVLLVIIYLSMNINIFNLIYHGLKWPTGYYYRQSFLMSFYIIYLGMIGFTKLNKKNLKEIIIAALFAFIAVVEIILYKNKIIEIELDKFSIIMILIYTALLIAIAVLKGKKQKVFISFLVIGCLFELIYNYNYTYKILNYSNQESYVNTMEEYETAVEKVKEIDSSFYRMEKTYKQTLNDSLTFNYYGIGQSSSMFDTDQVEFLKALGYNWYLDWTSYGFGGTPLLDSFLNIKYKLSNKDLSSKEYYLEYVDEVEGYNIYKNKYALSLGFTTSGQVDLDLEKDPFAIQEEIFKNITGESDLFNDCKLISKEEENITVEGTSYTNVNENSKIICTFDISDVENDLYLYLDTNLGTNDGSLFKVLINGDTCIQEKYIGSNVNGILQIDKSIFEGKDKITIEFAFNNNMNVEIYGIYLKEMNVEKYAESFEKKMQEEQLTNIEDNGNRITGTIILENDSYMVLTISYDEAWEITVNGEKVDYEKTLGDLIGINLNKGENKIEMKYISKGFKTGCTISIISIIVIIIYIIIKKIRQMNEF